MKHFKIISIVLLCLGMVPLLYGQDETTWMRTYDIEGWGMGMAVHQTIEDQYLIAGYGGSVESYEDWDILLMKIDINGDTVWTKTYDHTVFDIVESMEPTSEGGYILTGFTEDTVINSDSDTWLINIDTNGDTVWTKIYSRFSSDRGYTAQQTVDGGYIIAGQVNFNHWDNSDGILIKTDENGEIQWTKTDTSNCEYFHVEQTADDGYIIASRVGLDNGNDIEVIYKVIKTDPLGDTIWTKSYENFELAWKTCINQTTDGGYIITGNTNSEEDKSDVWLEKIDENGLTVWTKTYITDETGGGEAVQQTEDGGFIILARKFSYPDGEDYIWQIKTDAYGDTLWTKTYFGIGNYSGEDIKQTSDGGFIILGNTGDTSGRPLVWMIKTDANGNETPSSVDENMSAYGINIYPNPTNDLLTIETVQPGIHTIEITSLNGQLLYSDKKEGPSHQIDLSAFQKGLYFITIRSRDYVSTEKIIKL